MKTLSRELVPTVLALWDWQRGDCSPVPTWEHLAGCAARKPTSNSCNSESLSLCCKHVLLEAAMNTCKCNLCWHCRGPWSGEVHATSTYVNQTPTVNGELASAGYTDFLKKEKEKRLKVSRCILLKKVKDTHPQTGLVSHQNALPRTYTSAMGSRGWVAQLKLASCGIPVLAEGSFPSLSKVNSETLRK